jgi:hypothetical protein
MRISEREKKMATASALAAKHAHDFGKTTSRDGHIEDLFGAVGFWNEKDGALMIHLPNGQSIPWQRRWEAVLAWAAHEESRAPCRR